MYKKINNKKKSNHQKRDESVKPKDEQHKNGIQKVMSKRNRRRDDELKSIQFASGNSSVEVTNGIIYYYLETDFKKCEEKGHKSELILMLQVPITFTTQELLQFTGPVSQTIEQIRIIRDCKPNQYMALIKLEKIELINNAEGKTNIDLVQTELSMVGEQTTCTFCLENMNDFSKKSKDQTINTEYQNNEKNGAILTVLCGHSFHSNCLMKWPDQYCPLCRCSQTPEHVSENICQECNLQQDSLWLCITCGHVGCGRYINGHAYLHFSNTQHNFAKQMGENNRVWDYAADNYVNRLLQTNDGKPVEVLGNSNEMNEKLEAVQLEYTYTLTNQLESQRTHYEQLIRKLEMDAEKEMEEIKKQNLKYEEDLKRVRMENDRLEKERDKFEKKFNTIEQKYNKCFAELKEEKDLGKCLLEKQKELTEYYRVLEKKIQDKENETLQLRDEVRDLMFYVDVQNKLTNDDSINDEIKDGKISLNNPDLPTSATNSHSKPSRNKARKK